METLIQVKVRFQNKVRAAAFYKKDKLDFNVI